MRSSTGPSGSGPPVPSARSSLTAAAVCSKLAPTHAGPLTRSGGSKPSDLDLEGFGDGFRHVKKLTPNLGVGNRIEQPDELDRFRALQVLAPLAVFGAELRIIRS